MDGAGPVELFVDLDELTLVQSELQNLLAHVEGLDDLCAIHPDSNGMGSRLAADAIAQFGARWRTARNGMTENLGGCVTYVELALQSYVDVEQSLGSAVLGVGGEVGREPGGGGGGGSW